MPVFLHRHLCYGNEPSEQHACMHGHLATANQRIKLAKSDLSLLWQ